MPEYSIINKLKDQNKLDDSTLVCINALSLEDVIAVKLELSTNLLKNRLYGFDIWNKMNSITKEAVLRFALSVTKNKSDAARFLGLDKNRFNQLVKKYQIESYFEEKD